MNRCPITYDPCGNNLYSTQGLNKLSPRLTSLKEFPYSAQEQRREAAVRSAKMSIQGIQPKISTRLSPGNQSFEIVDKGGNYIIKPQSEVYIQVPENEDLTMKMASAFGINVPLTGLLYSKDRSLSYFIKRFDRYGKNKKYALEDFAQLTGNSRDTKYNWSMEKLLPVIDSYCTFPMIEKRKLFRRIIFCFITGNEDMHLKNFSLITKNNITELSPAYDLLNTTISLEQVTEELALPLAGKKRKITREILYEYYGKDNMKLTDKILASEERNLTEKKKALKNLINISFLNDDMKIKYSDLLNERYQRLIGK
jgi:serine/threonine-protein kinase HipA